MMHLDFHVLELVLKDQQRLREQGCALQISVNFTRTTLLMQNFVDRIRKLCETYGVPASCITLEVTESLATIDHERLQSLLQDIRQTGFRLSLDDFGSKYSNMAILSEIAFDEVKFDKTLVDSIYRNERSRVILEHLIRMCSRLCDTIVVAEGIEQEQQAQLLGDYGCTVGQGYYYYRPMPVHQLAALLQTEPAHA